VTTTHATQRTSQRDALYSAVRVGAPFLALLFTCGFWHVLSLGYPAFILPGPLPVLSRLAERLIDGSMLFHLGVTLGQAIPGLLIGALLAFAVGYPIARSAWVDRALSPFVVASQGIPFVAVAPLLFIWFGSGITARLLICALIVFFPIAVNVIAGIRSVPRPLHDLFTLHRASRKDRFAKLELPAALPYVFAGLRTGGTLSMIGALTGEFIIASDRGMGFVINQAYGSYDTATVMAGILVTVAATLSVYGVVRALEARARRVGLL
jgi:NitT/TauT family transport system permease protein